MSDLPQVVGDLHNLDLTGGLTWTHDMALDEPGQLAVGDRVEVVDPYGTPPRLFDVVEVQPDGYYVLRLHQPRSAAT